MSTTTTCSSCRITLTLTSTQAYAVAPGNGKRGSKRTGPHLVISPLWTEADVSYWDCPVCDHPDSFDPAA